MYSYPRKPDRSGNASIHSLSLSAAIRLATTAMVEVAKIGGIARLDALHASARRVAEFRAFDGMSPEIGAAIRAELTIIDLVYHVARHKVTGDIEAA